MGYKQRLGLCMVYLANLAKRHGGDPAGDPTRLCGRRYYRPYFGGAKKRTLENYFLARLFHHRIHSRYAIISAAIFPVLRAARIWHCITGIYEDRKSTRLYSIHVATS